MADTFVPSLVSANGDGESESQSLSAPQTVEQPDRRSASPPPNCPICLTACVNYSTTDVCKHRFCFECIKQWAKVKNECPLCKKRFRSIYHDFESDTKYSRLSVANARGHLLNESIFHSFDFPVSGNRLFGLEYVPRYVYSTTLRINEQEQHSLHEYFLRNPNIRFLDFNMGGVQPQAHVHRVYNRYSSVSTTSFRRSIYLFSWWSMVFPDSLERVTREDYIANPDFEEKLRPWLNREAIALLGGDVPLQSRFIDVIHRTLRNHSINTRFFMMFVEQYLQNRSLHFMHELCIFLRSRLDMQTYDHRIRFTDAPDPGSSIFSEIVNNVETPLNLSTEAQAMAGVDVTANVAVMEAVNHSGLPQPSMNEPYPFPGHIEIDPHSPLRPEDFAPEVIIIDSNTDNDSDTGDLTDPDVVYQGTTTSNYRPVEVVELLSDSDSDSVLPESATAAIFLNSRLSSGPLYRPSNTITIDSSPNLSSSSSSRSSLDDHELAYPIQAIDVTNLQLAIDPLSGMSSTTSSTSTSTSTSTSSSSSSTSSTSTLTTPQPSPISDVKPPLETFTPSTTPPNVQQDHIKIESSNNNNNNTATASTSAAADLASSSSGLRNSIRDLVNSLRFRVKRSKSTSSSSSESSATSSISNSSRSAFRRHKRLKRRSDSHHRNRYSRKKSHR